MKFFGMILSVFLVSQIAFASYTIPDGGVHTRQLADTAVTTAKITNGAVTAVKLAALNIQQGNQLADPFSTASTTAVNINGMGVSITTSGRPVLIAVLGNDGNSQSTGITGTIASGSSFGMTVLLDRDSSLVTGWNFNGPNAAGIGVTAPVSTMWYIDFPSAGTHSYQLQAQVVSGTTLHLTASILVAYEL